jgi:hypothetical protein
MECPKKTWMIGGVLPFKHEETSDKRVKTDNLINWGMYRISMNDRF